MKITFHEMLTEAAEEYQAVVVGGPAFEARPPWRADAQSFLAGIILTLLLVWYFNFLDCGKKRQKSTRSTPINSEVHVVD